MPLNKETPPPDTPDYGFIFQDGQKPKRHLGMPKFNLPIPVAVGLLVIVFIMLLFVALSFRSGSGGSPMQNIAARQTEILRVANLASPNIQDPQNQNLVGTVTAVFSSARMQSAKYLNVKAESATLNIFRNKATDSELETAGQNNRYDEAYLSILKASLINYQSSVSSAIASASPSAKDLLTVDLADAQTLLDSPQLKSL